MGKIDVFAGLKGDGLQSMSETVGRSANPVANSQARNLELRRRAAREDQSYSYRSSVREARD